MESEITEDVSWKLRFKNIKWFLFALCFGIIGFCFSIASMPTRQVIKPLNMEEEVIDLAKKYTKTKDLNPTEARQVIFKKKQLYHSISIGLGILTMLLGIGSLFAKEAYLLGLFAIALGLWAIYWQAIIVMIVLFFIISMVAQS